MSVTAETVSEIWHSFSPNAFYSFFLKIGIIMARSGQMIKNQLKIK